MSLIHPENNLKPSDRNTNREILSRIRELILLSSAHGFPRLLRAKNLFTKLMWSTILLTTSVLGSFVVVNTIFDYFKFETTTQIGIVDEKAAEFPTISLCGSPSFNSSLNETIFKLRFNQKYENNISKYFEVYYDTVYGQCFRFNSGKNVFGETYAALRSTHSGAPNGLRLDINLKPPEDYDYIDVLVNFHNRSSPPLDIYEDGYWLTTGSWNFFKLNRIISKNLGEPYSSCLEEINKFRWNKTLIEFIMKKKQKYSQKECFSLCSYLWILEQNLCKCNSSLDKFEADCKKQWFEVEYENSTKMCVNKYLAEFRYLNIHDYCLQYCPLECDTITYTVYTYNEIIPIERGKISEKKKRELGVENMETYEQLKKNYASMVVFYSDIKYTYIRQHAKIDLFECFASVGGSCSLFFGVSLISILELFEIMFEVFYIIYKYV